MEQFGRRRTAGARGNEHCGSRCRRVPLPQNLPRRPSAALQRGAQTPMQTDELPDGGAGGGGSLMGLMLLTDSNSSANISVMILLPELVSAGR
jgi:hypothetical protein